MNYNINHICTYKELNDDDKYREDILHIFNLTKYDDIVIENNIENLFTLIKKNKILISCCTHLANKVFSSDLVYGFIFLFSFEYLYLTHKCMCELIQNNEISEESLQLLKQEVFAENK